MYANLMREIGWQVKKNHDSQIYYRTLGPLTIAKLQRPKSLDLAWIKSFRKTHKTVTTYIEPGISTQIPINQIGIKVEPFAHSNTSILDLSPTHQSILKSFSQKTRYNIVHSLKKDDLKITTTQLSVMSSAQTRDFYTLHEGWSKQKNVIGYSKNLLKAIIKSFAKSGDIHQAYLDNQLVAILLVLYHDSVATYWAAFSTISGYKSFAPTQLTWAAIQAAKARGCDIFDFGGIYDPRYPRMYRKWLGFTKFKSGFNPTVVSYPPTKLQLFW